MKSDRAYYKWHLLKGAGGVYVVCEVLRLIADEIYNLPPKKRRRILRLLVDAYRMVNKMGNRLHYYYETYNDKTGSRGRKVRRLPGRDVRKQMRRDRVW